MSALLWDESYLWGVWLYDALRKSGIAFDIIKANELNKIDKYKVLFVPGGWASNKIVALGDKGSRLIKEFVAKGGVYFGICGGAGLATKDGLGLVAIKRKKDRVPSFSGPFLASLTPHPLWQGIRKPRFYLWWPSEFAVEDENIKVLATFKSPLPGSFSSDLSVDDFSNNFQELETLYGIKLDPLKMTNTPLVVEAPFDRGKVILSLIHFDTPYDKNGLKVFKNLKEIYSLADFSDNKHKNLKNACKKTGSFVEISQTINELLKLAKELLNFGERNFLLFRRYNFMYQWRRGIRGFEYLNLYYTIKRIKDELDETKNLPSLISDNELKKMLDVGKYFVEKAKELLKKERIALITSKITFNYSEDSEINSLREELFGNKKSYGGMYKNLLEKIDNFLYFILKGRTS